MVIVMVTNSMSERVILMLHDLMILIMITMILMMKIAMMENFKWWKSAGLDVDYLMMRNSMLWSFMVSAKIMKESMITVIIHAKYLQFKRQDKYEIPVVFRNVWNYDNHFIIKQLVEEFEEKFECLGENLKSYVTFSALIETQKNAKIVKHKIRFIEHVVFMNNSLSSLIDSLAEGQCKDFKSSLEYVIAENGLLTFKCVDCNTRKRKIYLRASKTRISFAMETSTASVSHSRNVLFIHGSLRKNHWRFITNKEGILICN